MTWHLITLSHDHVHDTVAVQLTRHGQPGTPSEQKEHCNITMHFSGDVPDKSDAKQVEAFKRQATELLREAATALQKL